jgi:iron complex transport system permease protein
LALVFSLLLVAGNWRQLDIWMLGESVARQSGVNTRHLLYKVVLALCLCVGLVVAFCGVMGFIGLLVPHAVRLLMGMSHKAVIWASLLAGAIMMLLADITSQLVIARVELPIGLVLAMVGGPLFILLLLRVQKHGWR